jgi:hypothetical protein
MFIEHEPQIAIQAPSGAAWLELSAWLHRVANVQLHAAPDGAWINQRWLQL